MKNARNAQAAQSRPPGMTQRPQGSSFLRVPYRILNGSFRKYGDPNIVP